MSDFSMSNGKIGSILDDAKTLHSLAPVRYSEIKSCSTMMEKTGTMMKQGDLFFEKKLAPDLSLRVVFLRDAINSDVFGNFIIDTNILEINAACNISVLMDTIPHELFHYKQFTTTWAMALYGRIDTGVRFDSDDGLFIVESVAGLVGKTWITNDLLFKDIISYIFTDPCFCLSKEQITSVVDRDSIVVDLMVRQARGIDKYMIGPAVQAPDYSSKKKEPFFPLKLSLVTDEIKNK